MNDEFQSDFERAQFLQNLLIDEATGGSADSQAYREVRKRFVDDQSIRAHVPEFVRTNRDTSQFWQFIKFKFPTYAERRNYIYTEFAPFLNFLETADAAPADTNISDGLKSFDSEGVHTAWERALARRASDPEGAITAARTLLETVCKHILDASNVQYNSHGIELPELYKLTAKQLNLSPSQHGEEIFRQILGGCASVVHGLGALRNRFGDAHGQGKRPVRPAQRHAELAVNLAGSVALFLITTFVETDERET